MRLTGYVVIELKTGKFQPDYAGNLDFYVALVDDAHLEPNHAPGRLVPGYTTPGLAVEMRREPLSEAGREQQCACVHATEDLESEVLQKLRLKRTRRS
ncbi:hypothetical protein C9424_16795 [Arthrobacter sp. H-02-3]|nr:hypothetical protein C9424_16795 [Arthrobacter sp. H-02-3]